jgi:hypothetical protein
VRVLGSVLSSPSQSDSILDFKQVWSFFFKPRRISGKRRSTFSNSLSLFTRLLMLKELLGIFEIMGATSD